MSPWDTLPVSPPETVHDWAAFRELHRHDLSSLDIETLSVLYGFSSLVEYRDEECLRSIEQLMDEAADPVRARYDLAWHLGEFFDDKYFWKWRYLRDPSGRASRLLQPGEPDYIQDIPPELHAKVVGWLVEGIKRFRDDEELFQHVRTIAARALSGDTFLDDDDIEPLRQASNDELTLRTDKRAQELLGKIVKDVNQSRDDQ